MYVLEQDKDEYRPDLLCEEDTQTELDDEDEVIPVVVIN